jgi:hypothetical protein
VTKGIATIAVLALFALPSTGAIAQTKLSPQTLYEGAVPQKDRAPSGQTSIKSWELFNHNDAWQDIPLTGFYVAHLLGGDIAAMIDGQTTNYQPGSYWTVKAGAKMQVKVLGETAVLETITANKQ